MTIATKKNGHGEKKESSHAGDGGKSKAKDSRVIIITATLSDELDDDKAEAVRTDVSTYLETWLKKRLDKQLKDLVVH
jgi:hypothetical protein